MRRTWSHRRSLVAAVALLAAGAFALGANGALADAKAELAGTWRIDRKASDQPGKYGMGGPGGMHEGRGGGQGGHGGHGDHGGPGMGGPGGDTMGGPPPDGERKKGGRPGRLGPWLRIETSGAEVTVADSSGTTVREIVLGDAAKPKNADDGAMVATGKWKGSKLEVTAVDPRGREHKETWELSDEGKTLTIFTKLDARGDRPAMEMKRVYRRASA
jgi:hypothetical protein